MKKNIPRGIVISTSKQNSVFHTPLFIIDAKIALFNIFLFYWNFKSNKFYNGPSLFLKKNVQEK